jgi:FkbM family methyltransferase
VKYRPEHQEAFMTSTKLLPSAAQLFAGLPRFFRRHRLIRAYLWLTREDPVQLVRIRNAAWAYVDLRDGFQRLIVIDGHFEADFFRIADALMANGGDFLDVGANFGLLSFGLLGSARSPIRTHLFEPNQTLVETIYRSLKNYEQGNCIVVPFAVFSVDGEARFLEVPEQTGISHLIGNGGKPVKTISIDTYLSSVANPAVPLMKVDVEGHELSVLLGADQALTRRRLGAIYFEYCKKHLERTDSPGDPLPFLREKGYEVCFCHSWDLRSYGPPTHTIAKGYPGHGLPLVPIAARPRPTETDLLAVPSGHLVPYRDQ